METDQPHIGDATLVLSTASLYLRWQFNTLMHKVFPLQSGVFSEQPASYTTSVTVRYLTHLNQFSGKFLKSITILPA